MRLLEHEAKQILSEYGLSCPQGQLVDSADQTGFKESVVIKAQVPIGGRGLAGGVITANTPSEAQKAVNGLFKKEIFGYRATRVLVEEQVAIEQELYAAVLYDTVEKLPRIIFSLHGGVHVETADHEKAGGTYSTTFTPQSGLAQYQGRELAAQLGLTGKPLIQAGRFLSQLARIFLDFDATLLEVNPLAITSDGRLIALDAHMSIDEDALGRQPKIAELASTKDRYSGGKLPTEFEMEAEKIDKSDHRGVAGRVIEFGGDLGLVIGGGGASLTAFDAIKAHGGEPANYCEVGGNPSVKKIQELIKLLLSQPKVNYIAVISNVVSNTRVDLFARGVIKGVLESGLDPAKNIAVFRVPGAWEEEGYRILSKYGVRYVDRTCSIDEAAKIAIEHTNQSNERIQ